MDEYKWFRDDFQNGMSSSSKSDASSASESEETAYAEQNPTYEYSTEGKNEFDDQGNVDYNTAGASYTVFDEEESSETEGTAFYSTSIKPKKNKKKFSAFSLVAAIVITAVVTVSASYFIPGAIDDVKTHMAQKENKEEAVADGETSPGSKIVAEAVADSKGNKALTTPEIVDLVGPAVVGIVSTTTTNYGYYGYYGFSTPQEQSNSGSGVIISSDGYIVTNNHVVENAKEVKVILNTNDSYAARVVGTDSRTDLAVLKIDASELPYAKMGESSELRVGDTAIAIGNPLGQEFAGTTTQGIISGLNRSVTIENKQLNLIQTDAAINPGNSGGALVNAYGQLIGINTAKISSSSLEGLGFAIPIDEAKPIISDLIDNGYVKGRPVIGIGGRAVTEQDAKAYNLKVGVYVASMTPDSPAHMAGIKIGDIIVECDGKKVTTIDEINTIKNKKQPGDEIKIKVYRQGSYKELALILGEEIPSAE